MIHNLIPCIYLLNRKAVTGFGQKNLFGNGDPVELAASYSADGADSILIFDFSSTDAEHDEAIDCIREICLASQVPVYAAGHIKRVEDVKKLIYAGCAQAVLNGSKEENIAILEEVSKRFGKEKIGVCVSDYAEYEKNSSLIEQYAASILLLDEDAAAFTSKTELPVTILTNGVTEEQLAVLLEKEAVGGVTGRCVSDPDVKLSAMKTALKKKGIAMNVMTSAVSWSEFKKDANGLVPCIVQDYRTDEVLMMAWMNEESFEMTLDTGKMTYFSRSRQSLWVKGETSGHYQYVKSLSVDCDKDTILAKVSQIGAACHTGNRSCFYTPLAKKEFNDTNPYRVFENVMNVILDRREHPKEGSYTNYLFDKGIDKILKKVGEECTEIIIAAKNPNPEEIKYEISDYLYHLMVLMAEKGVTWEEVTDELARR
ncbi:MAG: bifunctional phosphoribosyl-AMP cyclohydrolase/phosphoribosyl-ATP diphosphatase HisIE [Lachnospiraceae bacterium]|nr:bifunctional phosphoribosyl-AMP cyclohydrolase/phosphoribosyl-ATP diphosphatase HisIE [Lachnospiraceae bacterium]